MRLRSLLISMMILILILPTGLVSAASPATPLASQDIQDDSAELAPSIRQTNVGWRLTSAKVTATGETAKMQQGTLTTGYTVVAVATAITKGAPIEKAKFELTLSAFSPSKDMPGQKAGRWYLRGTWTLTDQNATQADLEVRHNPAVIRGDLLTELSFNPATDPGAFSGKFSLPMSLAAGQWSKGEGTISFDENFEGSIYLAADEWPELSAISINDVPGGRGTPAGTTIPNPGTQEQELANITFPAPYNTFEFVVTCAACHGGTVDQQAGHFGNWAGTAMASAARDPIFRANQQIVNDTIKSLTGTDGGGNICIRCHSPNAWYSGRTDPLLAGQGDASNMIHSILLSTDDEGILCEFCHRSIGNVTMRDPDLLAIDPDMADDPAWNMLQGLNDWPHQGDPYPEGPADGNPYGDNTMQVNDGMAYTAKYPGYVMVTASDVPMTSTVPPTLTNYTGQTYAVYPPFAPPDQIAPAPPGMPRTNPAGEYIYYGPDGSVPIHLETPVGPPIDSSTGDPDYQAQAVSLEHPTYGAERDANGEGSFVTTPEFCGTCHDLTIPVLNHGMPEQRTYTEWKYSDFGDDASASYTRCQDCHMPTMKHEYADDAPVSVNPDPTLAGWWPYAKDRNPDGGTAFHKFDGANLDLPQMMKLLYPEPDLEVIGVQTGHDTRVFPGMLSNRDPMLDRSQRNNELSLRDAVDVAITDGPTLVDRNSGLWEVTVKVTNLSGHKIPSGYPDGRRFWIGLQVTDAADAVVYESGVFDPDSAQLYTDSSLAGFSRALSTTIDATVENAVMVYEKRTGTCSTTTCTMSVSLLNDKILFDNRIPPAGFTYADYQQAGAKFWNYDPATLMPYEEVDRYPDGQNWDEVTYRFTAPADAVLDAQAEVLWQTHTREFMEHLKTENTNTYRPEGPPSIFDPNYPLTPNYLSDQLPDFANMTDLDGNSLRDNWGGIAYASWLLTGKGAPYVVAADDTAVGAAPAAPVNVVGTVIDPFTIDLTWDPVPGAEGYVVWTRYGVSDATAAWDRIGVVYTPTTEFQITALNVAKTYGYQIEAFNSAGSTKSTAIVVTTPTDLPLAPINTMVVGTTGTSITLSWFDQADNETHFVIERQDVPVQGNFYALEVITSTNVAGTGGVNWTDTTAQPATCYNYRVAAQNASGMSTFDIPVQGCTGGAPGGSITLAASVISGYQVDLSWSGATGTIVGYRVERSSTAATGPWDTTFVINDPNATGYSDTTVQPQQTYWYRVFAWNYAGDSAPSNVEMVTTTTTPPAAPTDLTGTPVSKTQVDLAWLDNATNEAGFSIERGEGSGPRVAFAEIATIGPNAGTGPVAFSDTGVVEKMTYSYRVRAFNDGGPSGYSNVVVVITPGEIPQAPSELRIVRVSYNYIAMRWRDNSTNEAGFYVERSLDGTNWSRVATVDMNISAYKDTGLARRTTYWYRVQAFNASGVSEYSEVVSGRTR